MIMGNFDQLVQMSIVNAELNDVTTLSASLQIINLFSFAKIIHLILQCAI